MLCHTINDSISNYVLQQTICLPLVLNALIKTANLIVENHYD